MLRYSGNLRIFGSNCSTFDTSKPYLASISLQRCIDQSSSHTVNITTSFSVGEGLVSCCLMKTIGV